MSYIAETIELDEHPGFRAQIIADEYPSPPEFEAGYPVIQLTQKSYYPRTDGHVYGQEVAGMEWALDKFLMDTDDGYEVFARYLRIFHDGDAVVISRPTSREYGYVVYGTRSLLDSWGCTADSPVEPEAKEWEAYIEGDVYGIVIERRTLTETTIFDADGDELDFDADETWTEVESCWGFYGSPWGADSYVAAEAREMLLTEATHAESKVA